MKTYSSKTKRRPISTFRKVTGWLLLLALLFEVNAPVIALAAGSGENPAEISTNTIVTGDAVVVQNIDNTVNTSLVNSTDENVEENDDSDDFAENTSASTTSSTTPAETDDSTEDNSDDNILPEIEEIIADTATSTTATSTVSSTLNTASSTASSTVPVVNDIDIENQATTTNDSLTVANTGTNETEAGYFITETGDAVAYVDIVNMVNTNIINSEGLVRFIRDTLGYGDFDIRDLLNETFTNNNTALSTALCAHGLCSGDFLNANLINQANIENNVTVMANTGSNTGVGNGEITTGDAYASANVANLANTNIIDSNFLLLVFDGFSNTNGNLILPESTFFTSLFGGNNQANYSANIDNNANIENTQVTLADTGNNSIVGGDGGIITTGSSIATSYTQNIVNQNFINTNSFSMLIRVQGTWTGNIFGLPQGMTWENTGDGIRLFYTSDGSNAGTGSSGLANITNDANITNNVQVYALTGDNHIEGTGEIETGDAYADSTIFNMANTNVIGSNWANLIFNLYNWQGDILFGQSNLWLGVAGQTENTGDAMPGETVKYTYTVFNSDKATAENVHLTSRFPLSSITFLDAPEDLDDAEDIVDWALGDIAPGETVEFSYTARITDTYGTNGRLALPLEALVSSANPDADETDNYDSVLLYVGKNTAGKSESPRYTFPAKFSIEKSANTAYASAGDRVDYTIKVVSKGGPVYDTILVDVLKDTEGNELLVQAWPLDFVDNGETITITYSIDLPENAPAGIYSNSAWIEGSHGSQRRSVRQPYYSQVVTHNIEVGPELLPAEMLGYNSLLTCEPYLHTYLKINKTNDYLETIKLQSFLKGFINSDLEVTGKFDQATDQAVRAFQEQYRADILDPWGMKRSSGYVYYTTQKKINEIMCNYEIEFPLSADQQQEVTSFRFFNGSHNPADDGLDELFGFSNEINNTLADTTISSTSPTELVKNSTNSNLRDRFLSSLPALKNQFQHTYSRLSSWLQLFKSHTLTALAPDDTSAKN